MIDPDSWLLVATLVEECIYVRQFFYMKRRMWWSIVELYTAKLQLFDRFWRWLVRLGFSILLKKNMRNRSFNQLLRVIMSVWSSIYYPTNCEFRLATVKIQKKKKKKEAEWACPESELPLRFRSLNSSSRDLLPWRRPTRAIAVGTAPLKDRLQAAATARKPFHAMRNTMGIDPFFAALFSSAGDAEAT